MRTLLLLVLLVGGDTFSDGVRLYREGRYKEALASFAAAEERAGEDASAELLYNKALCALRSDKLVVAEVAAEKAAVRGGPDFFGLRDFLLGNAAFLRSEAATALARRPEAGPVALEEAIRQAGSALDFWQKAAVSRSDWPAARRNVERALLKLEELKKLEAEAERKRKKAAARPKPRPQPRPTVRQTGDPERDPRNRERVRRETAPVLLELSAAQVQRLLDKLSQKEQEKRKLRRERQRVRRLLVERDW